ncbi:hypothetical protein D3X11_05665 [Streptococcus sp. X16XC17]|uniref:hypothetical protein n=1 Tax=unclassified Streptococcus TaxID=2608887 RepID=UPI00066FC128|nr:MULTISPECIES: hypothetical protein [unclassified Streptococcus]TCD45709.1 hypothetical protein D3X11_05665 [Streptococcus sp. X16XC17]
MKKIFIGVKNIIEKYRHILMPALILLSALWFTIICIDQLSHPGDQAWFAQIIGQFRYGYIGFMMHRYMTWSSRFFLEGLTAYFSVHIVQFIVTIFITTFFFIKVNVKDFEEKFGQTWLSFLVPILFLGMFSIQFFVSAGLVATMTNYYIPMAAFRFAFHLKGRPLPWMRALSIPFLILAMMQEQFMILLLLIMVYQLFIRRSLTNWNMIFFGIGLLGLGSAMCCPGNAIRKATEIPVFFPNFDRVSLLERIMMIFMHTSDELFAITYPFLFLFLGVLLLVACWNRRRLAFLVGMIPSVLIAADCLNLLGFNLLDNMSHLGFNLLDNMSHVIHLAKEKFYLDLLAGRTIRYTLLYIVMYCLIGIVIYGLFKEKRKGIWALYFLVIGFATRLALAMSATMFASKNRTLVPFIYVLFMLSLYILQECRNYPRKMIQR